MRVEWMKIAKQLDRAQREHRGCIVDLKGKVVSEGSVVFFEKPMAAMPKFHPKEIRRALWAWRKHRPLQRGEKAVVWSAQDEGMDYLGLGARVKDMGVAQRLQGRGLMVERIDDDASRPQTERA